MGQLEGHDESSASALDQYLVIRQGDRHLGVAIDQVVEIIRMVAIDSLPESSEAVAGVVNYRGDIIPILNLWHLLDQPTPRLDLDLGIVILEDSGYCFGIIVDRILGVESLGFKPRPDELREDVAWPVVTGVSYLDEAGGMVLSLNLSRLRFQQADAARTLLEER